MGTWNILANPPAFNPGTMLLLTDGSVMCHDSGWSVGGSEHWWRLTPDANGSYLNGTWSALAPMSNAPLFFASAVLSDGNVFVAGGEYNNGVNEDLLAAQVFDPVTNSWTPIATPAGWGAIGDAPCCVLPKGEILLGSINDNRTAIYDPAAQTWRDGAKKNNRSSSEETWTLLPSGSVLTADCYGHPTGEIYTHTPVDDQSDADGWDFTDVMPVDLVEAASIEIGPAILLPSGRVFAIGAAPVTAFFDPPTEALPFGKWTQGPSFPPQPSIDPGQAAFASLGAKDGPACLLPNGRVLCVVGPVDNVAIDYLGPSFFFEFDPAAFDPAQPTSGMTLIDRPSICPAKASADPGEYGPAPYGARLLLLPTGEVLFTNSNRVGLPDFSPALALYTPDVPAAPPAYRPMITSCPGAAERGQTYFLAGKYLNGVSQAVSYGDDATMATNYPLVRIRNIASGRVSYARTHKHSSMGVADAKIPTAEQETIFTNFTVADAAESGASELFVVANGIPSAPFSITIA